MNTPFALLCSPRKLEIFFQALLAGFVSLVTEEKCGKNSSLKSEGGVRNVFQSCIQVTWKDFTFQERALMPLN